MHSLIRTLDKKQLAYLLVLVAYIFQGIATLIYQVSWEQAMEKIVGTSLPTMSIIISMFFLGMAIGAYLFERVKPKNIDASVLFILNQAGIAICGLIFINTHGLRFLSFLSTTNQQAIICINLLRLSVLCCFLLGTSILIGATFPLLKNSHIIKHLSKKSEKLYLTVTSGSVVGAIVAGFVLLPNYGIKGSVFAAIGINVLAILPFALAIFLRQHKDTNELESLLNKDLISPLNQTGTSQSRAKNCFSFASVIALSAFFNMLLELLFMRLFVLFMGSSGVVFSLVTAVLLLALGFASFASSFLYKQKPAQFWPITFVFYVVAALWILSGLLIFPHLDLVLKGIHSNLFTNLHFSANASFFVSNLLVVLAVVFIPSFCLGSILPLYFQLIDFYPQQAPVKSEHAFAINLFASFCGCIAGGVISFPLLAKVSNHTIVFAFAFSAFAVMLTALFILSSLKKKKILFYIFSCVLCILMFSLLLPLIKRPLLTNNNLLFYSEGANSTVSILANNQDNFICLQTDGQTESTLPLNSNFPSLYSDESTHTLLGILPVLFCVKEPKSAFLIGFGSGLTAQTLLKSPNIKHEYIAELEPSIFKAAKYLNLYPNDRRIQIKMVDGRKALSVLNKHYDIIISQPGEPWRTSSRNLYTLEFWQLVKSRLKRGGIFSQWLPLYAMNKSSLLILCRTFAAVFPSTYIVKEKNADEIILLAINRTPQEQEENLLPFIEEAIKRCGSSEIKSCLIKIGYNNFSELINIFRLDPKGLISLIIRNANLNSRLNTDNFPLVYYSLQSQILNKNISPDDNIEKLLSENNLSILSSYKRLGYDFALSDIPEQINKIQCLIATSDFKTAVDISQTILKKQPNNFEIRFTLGKLLCRLGRSEEGLSQIKWAGKYNPQNMLPNLYTVLFYAFHEDWQLAQKNMCLLTKKTSSFKELDYLSEKISAHKVLDKNDKQIQTLMLKCHYPI